MLKTNLSTRPFYNERAIHWLLGIAAALVLALTAYNVIRIGRLTSRGSNLGATIAQDEGRARELTNKAAAARQRIDEAELQRVMIAAQDVNQVIDERAFSWTEFFNYIESTLPPNVMLTSVQPRVEKGQVTLTMIVLGREVEGVDSFIEQLEETKAFTGVMASQEQVTEEGLYQVALQGQYRPAIAAALPSGGTSPGSGEAVKPPVAQAQSAPTSAPGVSVPAVSAPAVSAPRASAPAASAARPPSTGSTAAAGMKGAS